MYFLLIECDITCEIVNQIALNWTTRPTQVIIFFFYSFICSNNVASPSSEDPTNKNQEKIDSQAEQTSHGIIVDSNVVTTDNIEAPDQSFNSATDHEEKEVYSHTDYNPAENTYGQEFNEFNLKKKKKNLFKNEMLTKRINNLLRLALMIVYAIFLFFHPLGLFYLFIEPWEVEKQQKKSCFNQNVKLENVAETTHAEDTHKRKDVKHPDKTAQETHAVERENRAHASWKDLAKGKQTV
ncbi:hypothetical protein RFI_10779 [Reticulomyxa filosa]|uniref:Uncharacterized protein n=1 Tax=Reticulomyxa filosa TaxID=46433 RepID=X6NJ66_RETFI|nr:hypothetical protein RFI_10779 [Reticulomyxa filosa]|eukprot:ETO26360.1 hypothetical protein RFI_10779 [Reticulomyxa filosa]